MKDEERKCREEERDFYLGQDPKNWLDFICLASTRKPPELLPRLSMQVGLGAYVAWEEEEHLKVTLWRDDLRAYFLALNYGWVTRGIIMAHSAAAIEAFQNFPINTLAVEIPIPSFRTINRAALVYSLSFAMPEINLREVLKPRAPRFIALSKPSPSPTPQG